MNFRDGNWRGSRNYIHQIGNPFSSMHYTITNYSTDSKEKMDMKTSTEVFSDELHRLNQIPDPLKKNLADTVITEQVRSKGSKTQTNMAQEFGLVNNRDVIRDASVNSDSFTPLLGITNFISSVFNVITSAVFQRRNDADYYDCYDSDVHQRSPSLEPWHSSKISELNKNQRACSDAANVPPEMTTECKSAADNCEQKLQKVRLILSGNVGEKPPTCRIRRPRKAFIEAGMVEEQFEDAIEPEDLVHIPDASHVKCVGCFNHQNQELLQIDSPIIKTEIGLDNKNDIKTAPEADMQTSNENTKDFNENIELPGKILSETETNQSMKQEIVSSCEDKVNKLKALLQQRRKHNTKSHLSNSNTDECIKPQRVHDKHYKNMNRLSCDKRKKSKLRKTIEDDLNFADEIVDDNIINDTPSIHITDSGTTVSTENDGFDEVSGRFRSTSATKSEDSFQIVFTDIPKTRTVSDCDSEDSFIIFEDTPDSCFTSNDVFSDETESESEGSDSESEVSDSGCGITQLAHQFSRTISDLTDHSLYDASEKQVDCAVRTVGEEVTPESIVSEGTSEDHVDCAVRTVADEVTPEPIEETVKYTGLLLDAKKKLLRKNQPPKKVHFSTDPPKVRVMRVWAFAARQARPGHWERHALDRDRFKRRIADVDMAVSWVLKPQHRSRVMFQRFMPWWNQLKRQELAEKKIREAEEKLKQEMEAKRKAEEELRQKEEEELRQKEEEEKRRAEEEEKRKKDEERLRAEAEMKKLMYHNFNGFKLNASNVEPKDWSKCRQTPTKLVQRLVIARESNAQKTANAKQVVKK